MQLERDMERATRMDLETQVKYLNALVHDSRLIKLADEEALARQPGSGER